MTRVDWPDTENRARWLERLGEAALLPTGDARRQAVEAEVARRGGWMRDEWLALVAEGERLRLALQRTTPPDDLQDRLLALPGRHWPLRLLPGRRPARLVAAVAVVALIVGTVWFVRAGTDEAAARQSATAQALHEVALLSISDHRDTHGVKIEAPDARALSAALSEVVPFEVDLPDLSGSFQLVGGRRCTLGSHPVAFSSWRGRGGLLTLLQVSCKDFDVPSALAVRHVRPGGAAARKHDGGAVLLARGGFMWVCVADDPKDLSRARTELERLGVDSD